MPISSEVMREAEIDTRLDRIEEAIDCLIRGEWQDADLVMATARAIRAARRVEEPHQRYLRDDPRLRYIAYY